MGGQTKKGPEEAPKIQSAAFFIFSWSFLRKFSKYLFRLDPGRHKEDNGRKRYFIYLKTRAHAHTLIRKGGRAPLVGMSFVTLQGKGLLSQCE